MSEAPTTTTIPVPPILMDPKAIVIIADPWRRIVRNIIPKVALSFTLNFLHGPRPADGRKSTRTVMPVAVGLDGGSLPIIS